MNKNVRFMTVVAILSSFLLLGSAYLIEFQNWLVFNQTSTPKSLNNIVEKAPGIRSMVSINLATSGSKNPDGEPVNLIDNRQVDDEVSIENTFIEPSLDSSADVSQLAVDDSTNKANDLNRKLNTQYAYTPVELNKELLKIPFVTELDEELLVEFPSEMSAFLKKRVISRLLTSSEFTDGQQLLSKTAIDTKTKPYYYMRVLNQYKTPVRYPAQAYRYAEYLLAHHSEKISEKNGEYLLVRIPLHKRSLPTEIRNYHNWVASYAKQFDVTPELVFAIMQTESAFNPKAVSRSNALGLMQIKPRSAGKDVYQIIDKKSGFPNQQILFNPEENIRIGTAYIGLLKNKYLKQVRNAESRELLMIASYNGGLSKALALFGDTPDSAIKRINQLHPRNIYRSLRDSHSSEETRRYVEKVLKNKEKFSKVLQEYV